MGNWVLIVLIGLGNPLYEEVDQMESVYFRSKEACEAAGAYIVERSLQHIATVDDPYYKEYMSTPTAKCFPTK